jgi:hypothetical protein
MTILLTNEDLTDFLASADYSRRDKILLILAYSFRTPLPPSTIKQMSTDFGLREIGKWNVADILAKSKNMVARLPNGWQLTKSGMEYVKTELLRSNPSSTKDMALNLRGHLDGIKNLETHAFVEEAIGCLEANLYRSAVVMSWAGAISILYNYVVSTRLADFNAEAKRRRSDWKMAVTNDDLALMKESDFLDILASLSIIGKNTKEHLKNNCLNLRNSCGHPSSLEIGKHTVEAHIEFLLLNVYEKF